MESLRDSDRAPEREDLAPACPGNGGIVRSELNRD
jgi:hypothetical protein